MIEIYLSLLTKERVSLRGNEISTKCLLGLSFLTIGPSARLCGLAPALQEYEDECSLERFAVSGRFFDRLPSTQGERGEEGWDEWT